MPAATMQSTPAIPPRPSRSQDKGNDNATPTIPPRPTKRFNRSISPHPDRFAPSPLNESPFSAKSPRQSLTHLGESIERSTSVDMPGVGEEGQEYAAAIEELGSSSPETNRKTPGSPEHTRTIGEDVKLYAPKPTVPASSAKQRVAAVTRTDSDRAAAFGIGRPSTEDQLHSANRGLKKKASTTSQLSQKSETNVEEEQGIPEIGQRVPMLAYAGDVQAPSPAPPRAPSVEGSKPSRNHARKTSSRGFGDLPPGSYGLRGHGVSSSDKLEKAYYEKHPELKHKEHYHQIHERVNDYSMSSEDLNKIVRDTASRGAGFGTADRFVSTPSEQVGFQATEEYTSRISRPPSAAPRQEQVKAPLKASVSEQGSTPDDNSISSDDSDKVIHVDDPGHHKGYAKDGDEVPGEGYEAEEGHSHPILASDEVAKDPSPYALQPAVMPPRERPGSGFEMEEPRSRPSSRPSSIYSPPPPEMRSTPLADVEEYEPLFPEDEKAAKKLTTQTEKLKELHRRFPSRDIWEDAPNSVHSTAEVSTPEPPEEVAAKDVPPRDTETPAQAFARQQEELAEKEAITPDSFLYRTQKPPTWAKHQSHLAKELQQSRPSMANRFPSRDIWEDTSDSLQFTTTVSTPQSAAEPHPEDASPTESAAPSKPTVPARPPRKQSSGDDTHLKPSIPGRPKPQIPARPSKAAPESKEFDGAAPKPKPAVPARPVGGKIAALQAGFMSDLNNRLRLGPQAPKKEEPPEETPAEVKEKAPLSDARKGRARGPQRRAPTAKSTGASNAQGTTLPPRTSDSKPVLSFSMTRTLWSIDEEGTMTVDGAGPEHAQEIEEHKPAVVEQPEENPSVSAEPSVTEEAPSGVQEPPPDTEPGEEPGKNQPFEPGNPDAGERDTAPETKTLATNTAGESILEETVEKKETGNEVKDVESVEDDVKV